MNWNPERLKSVSIGVREGKYEAVPANETESQMKTLHPEIFSFSAISIGDNKGQAFIVPLDESSKETAEYIIRAIKAYNGI